MAKAFISTSGEKRADGTYRRFVVGSLVQKKRMRLMVNQAARAKMEEILVSTISPTQRKRIHALLLLIDGESVASVAKKKSVSQRTIHNWVSRFIHGEEQPVSTHERTRFGDRFTDTRRMSGPRKKTQGAIVLAFCRLRERNPDCKSWSAGQLQRAFRTQFGIDTTLDTIKLALPWLG